MVDLKTVASDRLEHEVTEAFARGVEWCEENPLDREFRFKAGADYADRVLGELDTLGAWNRRDGQPASAAGVDIGSLTRPIIGIGNRTAQEAFDIMSDRIRSALAPKAEPVAGEAVGWLSPYGFTKSVTKAVMWQREFGDRCVPLYASPPVPEVGEVTEDMVEWAADVVRVVLEKRAEYFETTRGNFDRLDAARSYRSTISEVRAALTAARIPSTPSRGTPYLIWSNEHHAWWRANSQGYARSIKEAGLYTRDEAIGIAANALEIAVACRIFPQPSHLPCSPPLPLAEGRHEHRH